LQDYLDQLDAQRPFDASAGLGTSGSLTGFATSSVSWLEGARSDAHSSSDYQNTLLQRTSDALSNATGVNLDDEMSLMLDIERSYQSSSKLIGTIDSMFGSLLAAIG
jgi:flagellar hook-associated protein 1 FlgK